MKTSELLCCLDELNAKGIWLVPLSVFRVYFADESEQALVGALTRQVKTGVIERVARGLYANPRTTTRSGAALEEVATALRPDELCYLSLESALSEAGWLSQIPSRLTVMTTGRSQVINTKYGVIEFTHTKRDPTGLVIAMERDQIKGRRSKDFIFLPGRALPIATPERAWAELKRVGRSTIGLVQVPKEA